MRIGIDATFLRADSLYSGMGVYVRCLAEALNALPKRHDIVLLGYGPRPAAAPAGLSWQAIPRLSRGKIGPWLSHQLALPQLARHLHLDVLHIPGVNLRLSQPGIPFGLPCPLVVTMHDAIPLVYYGHAGPPLPRRLRLGYRVALAATQRAAAVITVSETSRRDLMRTSTINPSRLHVIPNGLDFVPPPREQVGARQRPLGITPPYLLYAGSYEPRKNLLGTVAGYRQALAVRDLPPLVLLVERESGHREGVMREVAASGVSEHLRFVHSLPDAALGALYRGASLFLYPSHYEGFGFTPLQAMASGVPVVASTAGSLPEVLGDAATYVESTSTEAIGQAIVDLWDRPEWAADLASRGVIRARQFRWDRAAQATLQVYETVGGMATTFAACPS